MHHEEADGLVVAGNSGNAEGAKGSDSRAMVMSQPDQGRNEWLKQSVEVHGATVRAG